MSERLKTMLLALLAAKRGKTHMTRLIPILAVLCACAPAVDDGTDPDPTQDPDEMRVVWPPECEAVLDEVFEARRCPEPSDLQFTARIAAGHFGDVLWADSFDDLPDVFTDIAGKLLAVQISGVGECELACVLTEASPCFAEGKTWCTCGTPDGAMSCGEMTAADCDTFKADRCE